ncbi:Leo1-like protein [Chloropicon primus]|uniref:Leo1-like protein n=1 Tax=Chloropicon primus TaxID=1764295 RepID=A0A5B8MGP0_9CHLO|nr:Leo1-like protein [Chloropicon primus]UPQ99058.1 Leo1-like protein [Chloropicon primus]|eukprot:QDZ19848.1 Leo1-like protein [Chloropicon primus]
MDKEREEDLFGSDSEGSGGEANGEGGKGGKEAEEAGGGEEGGGEGGEGMDDLFGGDSDEEAEKKGEGEGEAGGKALGLEDSDDSEGDDEDDEEPIEVEMVADEGIDTLLGGEKREKVLAKLSNIVGIEKRQFVAETFEAEGGGSDRREQFVIRWRVNGEGAVESNARIVRWSDGSKTLQVGDEHLDILQQDVTGDNVFVFARHEKGELMEGCVDLASKFSFRPTSVRSKAHVLASKGIDKKQGVKRESVKKITVTENPNIKYEKRVKEEEDRIKQLEKMQKKQEKEMAKYGLTYDGRDSYGGYRERGLSAGYLEGSDEEEVPDWDEDATRRAREELSRGRYMGDAGGEKRILRAKDGDEEEQTIKRQKFARGLDESSEEEDKEEDKRATTRGKAILMSDDED